MTSSRTALGLAAMAVAMSAGASERLWSEAAPDPCRVVVEHAAGDLELHRARGKVRVHGDPDVWALEGGSKDGTLRLRSAPRVGNRGSLDAEPLRVEVPRACELRVDGGAGRVVVHGRHDARLEVETVTGEIVLWAEDRADLMVVLLSSGEMGVDHSIEIEHLRHQEPDKRGLVVLGEGTVQVHLASKRGAVRVLERKRAVGH